MLTSDHQENIREQVLMDQKKQFLKSEKYNQTIIIKGTY